MQVFKGAGDRWGPLGEGADRVSELFYTGTRTLGYLSINSQPSHDLPHRKTPSGGGPQVLQQEVPLSVVPIASATATQQPE